MKKAAIFTVFILIFCNICAAEPKLLFFKSDITALKAKTESAEFKAIWKNYVTSADALCDSNSKSYADPNKVTSGYDDRPAKLRGHYFGRRLDKYMQNLGLAYYLTDNEKYRNHAVKLLVNYARILTVDNEYMIEVFAGGRGDMMRGLAAGIDMFGEFLTADEKKTVFETSKGYVDKYIVESEDKNMWWRPYHNFNGVCGGPAGCLALLLNDYDKTYAQTALTKVKYFLWNWLYEGFDRQGAYYEGVAYSVYGLENMVIFFDALKRNGGEDLFVHPNLKSLIIYYALSALPGEKNLDARNDSGYDKPGEILLKLASEYNNGLWKWVYGGNHNTFLHLLWANDIKPVSPIEAGMPSAEHFIGRGLCIWRTGWDVNDVMFSIESGKYYLVTHNQADKGHFTLYSHGQKWACDPGYANNRDPNGRGQTAAHNCVLIDGKGQAISGAGVGTNGKIISYDNNDSYGYALADCTEAYRQNIAYEAHEKFYNPTGDSNAKMEIERAYRHTFFVRPSQGVPAYAIILDDIAKDKAEHEYCWQMLSWPDLTIDLADPNMTVISSKDANSTNNAKMFVFIDSNSAVSLKREDFKVDPNDNRGHLVFPRLRAYSKTINPYFAAVLIATDGSMDAPKVKFEESPAEKTIQIEWPKRTDKIIWNKKAGKSKPQILVSYN